MPAAGAILLATGVIEDNPIAIVVAALFLPFLAQILAVSFGMWVDRRLIFQGLRALLVRTFLALAAGAAVPGLKVGRSALPDLRVRRAAFSYRRSRGKCRIVECDNYNASLSD